MGIPSYFLHIVKNHRSIIKKYNNVDMKIDNFYLDSNSVIYEAVRLFKYDNKENYENQIINYVCEKIEYYIDIIKPKKKILIAFDGVAPVAKLNQQKNRRYKSWFQNEVMKNIDKNYIETKWNTSAITPGTEFMKKLDKILKERFKNIEKYNIEKLILSTSLDVGEGEHKIYEYIRNNQEYHKNTKTVIYGLDADLIMLTLNHLSYSDKLYLFRETPYFIKNIDSTLIENSNYLLDIPEFMDKLVYSITDKEVDNNLKLNIIKDYVFICFLLGNDFMPHFPALNIRTNGIDIILNVYNNINKDLKKFILSDKGINWKNFREMIEILGRNEEILIKEEYKIRKKWENRKNLEQTEEQKFINMPMYERETENYINPWEQEWEYRYYKILFDIEINEERKKQICINYLSMLEWNYYYYNSECLDWRYKYNYLYPPLLKDLIKYIPFFDTKFLEKKQKNPINELVQLAYVLPRDSLNLLPKYKSDILLNKLNNYYKLDYKFEWAFCKYFWESHVKMEDLKIEEFENILKI